ncbi:short-chain dehydrogenase [Skermanella stibiiresistens SB22]|uniref:Short-chain dehydrogenase n=1 Tax=Skermanella stibiiresistens SB22 TaxID=1385369 RepID=W9HAC9_9PROT|nr:short-chain dehydrogenase [Skermanella stibiiresistens SB22]
MEGRVAIVTGGVRRIGRATALALAGEGASVVIGARSSRDEAEAVVAEIEGHGGRATSCLADVTDESAVDRLRDAALDAFGRIDILVNNAAMRRMCPFTEMSLAEWRGVMATTLDGAFLCSRAVLPSMLERGDGVIINIGGVTAHTGVSHRAHVATAKAGLTGLTRALAVEFGGRGITVNCVVPGKIGGERSAASGKSPGLPGGAAPLVGREGTAEEVAAMILALCVPAGRFVTGQTIHVSGGLFMG